MNAPQRRRRSKSSVEGRREQLRGMIGDLFARAAGALRAAVGMLLWLPGLIVGGLRSLFFTLAAWLRLPLRGARAVGRTQRSIRSKPWRHSRFPAALIAHWRLALGGLPAVAALVGVVVLAALRVSIGGGLLNLRYGEAMKDATAARDFSRAAICAERLLSFNPDDVGLRYNFAVAADNLGDGERAMAIMRGLAPENAPGYARAHLWQAHKLMTVASAADPRIEAHLLRARGTSTDSSDVEAETARYYLKTGRLESLERENLLKSVRAVPEWRLQYARLLFLAGRVGEARNEGVSLIGDLRDEVAREPAAWEKRLILAEAYTFLRQYGAAVDSLRQAAALTDSKQVVLKTAQTFASWLDVSVDDPKAQADVAARALDQLGARAEGDATALAVTARAAEVLGRQDEAERRYRLAAELDLTFRFELSRYYQRRNRTADARREAGAAIDAAEKNAEARPGDISQLLLAADAAVVLGEYQRAVDLLTEAGSRTPAKLGPAISRVYTAWWRERQKVDPAENSWPLVEKAIAADPWNIELLKSLSEAARGNGPQAEQADRKLREMLTRSEAPAPLHLVVGTDALMRGDLATARTHLEQAIRLDPSSADAANNLAWAVLHFERPDPTAALELINFALSKQPWRPDYLDTRGHVYMALERWQDALTDFENCRAAMHGNPTYHRALATTYRKLGLNDLAAEHERLAVGEEPEKKTTP